jgi:hypothetical protein
LAEESVTPAKEPQTTGDNPEIFQVTINLPNAHMKNAFEEWVMSGDFRDSFWRWMNV